MRDKIILLEHTARLLEPNAAQRKYLIDKTIGYTEDFLNNLQTSLTYVSSPGNRKGLFDSPISDSTINIDEVLSLLKENVDTPGINPASGGHLGYIPGGGIFHSSLGDFIAAITNRYAGVFFASPGAVRMENMLIDWMAELVGYPGTASGNLTSGGSISNLIAVVSAREAFSIKPGDIEKSVVYLTAQTHHSVEKSLRIAGLKYCIKHYIPMDDKFRMNSEQLEITIKKDLQNGLKPWLIIASAGTTDIGAVDPLYDIGEVADRYNLWLHVDGAYGAFFILSETGKGVLKGIEKSDSLIMDPHKGLFLPYGSGAVLVKEKMNLYNAHYYQADYMQDALTSVEELSPADLSPELSKHFRGLRLWLPLKLLGLAPFRAALEEKILLARHAYEKLSEIDNIELGPYPDLSIITFRYLPLAGDADEFNKKLIEAIHKDGRVFLSSTMINGKYTLRIAVCSFRTHLEEIDSAISIILEKIKLIGQS